MKERHKKLETIEKAEKIKALEEEIRKKEKTIAKIQQIKQAMKDS